MLSFGAGLLILTLFIPRKAFIDAAFVPYLLAAGIILMGTLQTFLATRLAERDDAAGEAAIDRTALIKTVALILGYIALMNPLGFPPTTAAYLFCQFIVLTPPGRKKNYTAYAIIAVVSALAVFYTFRAGFGIMLPAGLLG
jgi:putative tricarboxylic transport membrane protein